MVARLAPGMVACAIKAAGVTTNAMAATRRRNTDRGVLIVMEALQPLSSLHLTAADGQ
jgi:hypothetical protein